MPPEVLTSRETILVVDDIPHSRLIIEDHLMAAGYQVMQAENGKEAIEVYAASPVDLVLLDVMMPVMDGFEACRRLRAMEGGGRGVPILFLTSLCDRETHEKALDSGADDFISKPIRRVELLLRVKSLLRIKRLQNDLARSNELISSQRDALLRAQEQTRRLTAMVVHDLKGPLACVLGNAEYVIDNARLSECLQEALQDIHTTADSMHRMIMDLLDVARSEDGALTPEIKPVDVPDLIEEVRSYVRGCGRQSQHEITIESQPLTGPVQADKDLIRRVIENLVDNSAKYAPAGTEIQVQTSTPETGGLMFRISDRGPGVPLEYREKIFDQYVRLDLNQQGLARTSHGLGLAFCKLAVEAHGGEIWVEDNQPAGSVFCFRIPMAADRRGAGETTTACASG